MKVRKFFIGGFYEEWGAKHRYKEYFGPFLTERERKKIKCETYDIISTDGEAVGESRYYIVIYTIDIDDGVESLDLSKFGVGKFSVGYEGYDVALRDPWDSNPMDHYEDEVKETTIVRLYRTKKEVEEVCRFKIS